METELALAKEEKDEVKDNHIKERNRLQQNHDIHLLNVSEDLWVKIAQLEMAQSQLAEIWGNQAEELETKLIGPKSIHKAEITRVKTAKIR